MNGLSGELSERAREQACARRRARRRASSVLASTPNANVSACTVARPPRSTSGAAHWIVPTRGRGAKAVAHDIHQRLDRDVRKQIATP